MLPGVQHTESLPLGRRSKVARRISEAIAKDSMHKFNKTFNFEITAELTRSVSVPRAPPVLGHTVTIPEFFS